MSGSHDVVNFSGKPLDAGQLQAVRQAAAQEKPDQSIVVDDRGDVDLVPKLDAAQLGITPQQQGDMSLYDASGNPNVGAALGKIYAIMASQGSSGAVDVTRESAASAPVSAPVSASASASAGVFDPMASESGASASDSSTQEFLASVRQSFSGTDVDLSAVPGAIGGTLSQAWQNLTAPADYAHAINVIRTEGKN